MNAKTLKQLRADIAETQAEALAVKNALRPLAEIETGVRHVLGEMADASNRIVGMVSNIFSHGHPIADLVSIPAGQVPKFALGMALASIGVDAIIAAAKEKASANDNGALRMSTADRDGQLQALERQLYELQLAEEAALDGEPRRPGCNAAAVLGVPLEIAEQHGFTKIRGV